MAFAALFALFYGDIAIKRNVSIGTIRSTHSTVVAEYSFSKNNPKILAQDWIAFYLIAIHRNSCLVIAINFNCNTLSIAQQTIVVFSHLRNRSDSFYPFLPIGIAVGKGDLELIPDILLAVLLCVSL